MPSRKRRYELFVNGGAPTRCVRYSYSFSNTQGIILSVDDHTATVEMSLSSEKDEWAFANPRNARYVNALERTIWAWLLAYGRFGSIDEVEVSIDGGDPVRVHPVSESPIAPVGSALQSVGRIELPKEWRRTSVAQTILKTPQSSEGAAIAALTAYVLAKAKRGDNGVAGRTERFIYLWMAMNGYYNQLRREAFLADETLAQERLKDRADDKKSMGLSLRYHGLAWNSLSSDNRRRLAGKGVDLLLSAGAHGGGCLSERLAVAGFEELESDLRRCALDNVAKATKRAVDFSGYRVLEGFYLFELPYHLRCSYFHANKPMPLHYRGDDRRVACIALLSDFIELFLDDNLWRLFDRDHVEQEMRPRLTAALQHSFQ